jgi:hypothetical protein
LFADPVGNRDKPGTHASQRGRRGRTETDMKTSRDSSKTHDSTRPGQSLTELLVQIAANLAWNAC